MTWTQRFPPEPSRVACRQVIAAGEALSLSALITPTEGGIASRVLSKTSGGNLTLFAFDAGQGLTEHTSPFEALVMVLDGACTLTIGGLCCARHRGQWCGCRPTSLTRSRRL